MSGNFYKIPGLFQLSTLSFEVKDTTKPAITDDRGNSKVAVKQIVVTAQLDATSSRQVADFGTTNTSTVVYEGHIVSDDGKFPPDLLEGAIGTGIVNGIQGTVKVLPVEQTSITAHFVAGIGHRIRVEVTRRADWQVKNVSAN